MSRLGCKPRGLVEVEALVGHEIAFGLNEPVAVAPAVRTVVTPLSSVIDTQKLNVPSSMKACVGLSAAGEGPFLEAHTAITAGLRAGMLRPIVEAELPFEQAPESHRRVIEVPAAGKIVLMID